jgi:SAM-dependent methyltransferase
MPLPLRMGRRLRALRTWTRKALAGPVQAEPRSAGAAVHFQCNVCGERSAVAVAVMRLREAPSCIHCGSNLRFRTLIYGLSLALFGTAMPLRDFPLRKDIRGVGLSDARIYADILEDRLGYTNTFFHSSPKLDIAGVPPTEFTGLDFIVASDVFEHVAPPVDVAFGNARRMLRDGGVLLFSVPYVPGSRTEEHFPDLHDYTIEQLDGRHVLVNRTREGKVQRYENLVFHGGPGRTLEMRLFSLDDLQRRFVAAGFEPPRVLNDHVPHYGIDWRGGESSIPMVARARAVAIGGDG